MRRLLNVFRRGLWLLAGLVIAGASQSVAQSPTDCFSEDTGRRFSGCTSIIDNPASEPELRSQAFATRALTFLQRQLHQQAIDDFDQALAINPDFAVALNNRAWTLFKWGRGGDGLANVERSLQLDAGSAHTWDTRAHIRQSTGNPAGAFSDYERAIVVGGSGMIRLYQCGLSSTGRYRGRLDGIYSDELRDALQTCTQSPTCDPLPADEECKDPIS